ncbi:MAG: hypothetical protein WC749_02305 [Dehalococcoidia bacterium]
MTEGKDPTANVLDLVKEAVKRLDDLREAETRRANEMLKTHFAYTQQLSEAEAKRIDAIRAVDVAAVATASEKTAEQAVVLANQVATSAEALRNLVASNAILVAQQLQQITTQLTERLAILERAQYESKGRSGISVPLLMLIAGLAGGIIVFLIELLIK